MATGDGHLQHRAPPGGGASASACSTSSTAERPTPPSPRSAPTIKRRIYTTSRNGVYTFNPATLIAGTANEPGHPVAAPTRRSLPSGLHGPRQPRRGAGPAARRADRYPPNVHAGFHDRKTVDQCWLDDLQTRVQGLPRHATSRRRARAPTSNTKMQAARREARDDHPGLHGGGDARCPRRPAAQAHGGQRSGPAPAGLLLQGARLDPRRLRARDGGRRDPAGLQPSRTATPYVAEYRLFRDGPRDSDRQEPRRRRGTQIRQGFGLRTPDDDNTVAGGSTDTRTRLKPVMTVVYAPANDMLHAFRAGPCCSPAPAHPLHADTASATETRRRGAVGLRALRPARDALRLRAAQRAAGTGANHVYMLARGVRFADMFVRPGALTRPSPSAA